MKQRMMRIWLLIVAGMIMTLGVSGCMSKKQENQGNPEAIKNQMLAYLEEKYGEKFLPISFESSGFAYSHDTLWVYPEKGSKEDRFEIWGSRDKDGKYVMNDGYFGIYIKPSYEEVMSGFVRGIYKDFKLYTEFGEGVRLDGFNKDTKIEDIYDIDQSFSSRNIIFVKEDSAMGITDDEAIRKIAEQMKNHRMPGNIRIYVVYNDKFDSVGLHSLNATPAQSKELYVRERTTIKVTNQLEIRKYGE